MTSARLHRRILRLEGERRPTSVLGLVLRGDAAWTATERRAAVRSAWDQVASAQARGYSVVYVCNLARFERLTTGGQHASA